MKKITTMLLGAALSIILGVSSANAQGTATPQPTNIAGNPVTALMAETDFQVPADTAKDNRVLTNKFWSNWSINGAIGTQFYFGENDKYMKFGDRLTFPALDIYLNKWVTPVFGWGLAVSGYRMKGIYQPENEYAAFQTKDFYLRRDGQDYYWQKGNFVNPFLYFTLDLISCFGGYNPNRIYDLDLYAGGGIPIGFDSQFNRTAPTFNAGLVNRFRLTNNLGLLINLRGALVGDDFEGESRGQEPLTRDHIGYLLAVSDTVKNAYDAKNSRKGHEKAQQKYQQIVVPVFLQPVQKTGKGGCTFCAVIVFKFRNGSIRNIIQPVPRRFMNRSLKILSHFKSTLIS